MRRVVVWYLELTSNQYIIKMQKMTRIIANYIFHQFKATEWMWFFVLSNFHVKRVLLVLQISTNEIIIAVSRSNAIASLTTISSKTTCTKFLKWGQLFSWLQKRLSASQSGRGLRESFTRAVSHWISKFVSYWFWFNITSLFFFLIVADNLNTTLFHYNHC